MSPVDAEYGQELVLQWRVPHQRPFGVHVGTGQSNRPRPPLSARPAQPPPGTSSSREAPEIELPRCPGPLLRASREGGRLPRRLVPLGGGLASPAWPVQRGRTKF